MSIKSAFQRLFTSRACITAAIGEIKKDASLSSPAKTQYKGGAPKIHSRAPASPHKRVQEQAPGSPIATRPVSIQARPSVSPVKSVTIPDVPPTIRTFNACAPSESVKLPLDAVEATSQSSKLYEQFGGLPVDERNEFQEFLKLVDQEDADTQDRLARCFKGCVSVRQAFSKFARPYVEVKWKMAGAECPWPESVRLDVQLHLMEELDAVHFMLALEEDLPQAKAAFSHPAVKTLEQGKAIFDLYRGPAAWLKSRPDLVAEFASLSPQERNAFLATLSQFEAVNPGLTESVFAQKETTSLRRGLGRTSSMQQTEMRGQADIARNRAKRAAARQAAEAERKAELEAARTAPRIEVDAVAMGLEVHTDEEIKTSGWVISKDLSPSREALEALAAVEDESKVLTLSIADGRYHFLAVSSNAKRCQETLAVVAVLSKNWLVGPHLSQGEDFYTVADLKLALEAGKGS